MTRLPGCTCNILLRRASTFTPSGQRANTSHSKSNNRYDLGSIARSKDAQPRQKVAAKNWDTYAKPPSRDRDASYSNRGNQSNSQRYNRPQQHSSSSRQAGPARRTDGPSRHNRLFPSKGPSGATKGQAPAKAAPSASASASDETTEDPMLNMDMDEAPSVVDLLESDMKRAKLPRRMMVAARVQQDKERQGKRKEDGNNNTAMRSSTQSRKLKKIQMRLSIDLPSISSVANLARLFGVKLASLQNTMKKIGMDDTRPDRVMTSDDASLIALEYNLDPVVDNDKAFDIFPDPRTTDESQLLPRSPIVTIMGHVDHGKTTLLDKLRSTSVAAGEAGGITQHIGAFEVSLGALTKSKEDERKTITFLDTPGHAAFKSMRSRGRNVTDLVVLVIAADDGVKEQSKEVIDLVKDGQGGVQEGVGVVVAVTKCDKPSADPRKAKHSLADAGLVVEELGGEVPCVEVSGLTGAGLPTLIETLTVLAEVRDLRAEQSGVRAEGQVIESRVDKGKGWAIPCCGLDDMLTVPSHVATVIALRGTFKPGMEVVAGVSRGRIRQLLTSNNALLKSALPGQAVEVTGWKELPQAGDEVLQAYSEEEARKAIDARLIRQEQLSLIQDVEAINAKRREEAEKEAAQKAAAAAAKRSSHPSAQTQPDTTPKEEKKLKELLLLIKADVHGSQEALVSSLEDIGNDLAHVKIVASGVGDVTESDITRAKAVGATIIAFNVKCPRSLQGHASTLGVKIMTESVIYRLIEQVTAETTALLPVLKQTKIAGEATIIQVFHVTVKGRVTRPIAGCRVGNGAIARANRVRIMRGKEAIFEGKLDSLKHGKTDIDQVVKGGECGMGFENFTDLQEGDTVLALEDFDVKLTL